MTKNTHLKVWFSATSLEIENHIGDYRFIRRCLIDRGCVILFDWIEDAYRFKLAHPAGSRGIRNLFRRVIAAINEANSVVIEYTVPNFSTAHQIMYALMKRKPTLVLRRRKDNSFSDSYLDALESPFLTVREYTDRNLPDLIDEFIGEAEITAGLGRYNVVLDRKLIYYLDWVAVKTKVSRSELLRRSVATQMAQDTGFKKYLSKRGKV
jgi:hypothetical protein